MTNTIQPKQLIPTLFLIACFLPTGCSTVPTGETTSAPSSRAPATETVLVPDIEGKPCTEAEAILRQAGLVPSDTPVYGPVEEDAGGFISAYRQSPRPGTRVPKGSTVSYRWWWESS